MPLRVGPFYDGTEKDMLIIDTSQCRTRKPSVELLESVHLRPTYVSFPSPRCGGRTPTLPSFRLPKYGYSSIDDGGYLSEDQDPASSPKSYMEEGPIGSQATIGILGLPYALRLSGWFGLLTLLCLGIICRYTAGLLGKCQYRYSLDSYPDIVEVAFGTSGRIVVSIVFYIQLLFEVTVFMILLSTSLGLLTGANKSRAALISTGLLIMVANLCTSVYITNWLSLLGALSSMALFLCLLVAFSLQTWQSPISTHHQSPSYQPTAQMVGVTASQDDHDGDTTDERRLLEYNALLSHLSAIWWRQMLRRTELFTEVKDFIYSFGIYSYCYMGHAALPSIFRGMKRPSQFPVVIDATFAIMIVCYSLISCAAYMAYGQRVRDNVAVNVTADSRFHVAVNVLVIAIVVIKFALAAVPITESLFDWMKSKYCSRVMSPQKPADGDRAGSAAFSPSLFSRSFSDSRPFRSGKQFHHGKIQSLGNPSMNCDEEEDEDEDDAASSVGESDATKQTAKIPIPFDFDSGIRQLQKSTSSSGVGLGLGLGLGQGMAKRSWSQDSPLLSEIVSRVRSLSQSLSCDYHQKHVPFEEQSQRVSQLMQAPPSSNSLPVPASAEYSSLIGDRHRSGSSTVEGTAVDASCQTEEETVFTRTSSLFLSDGMSLDVRRSSSSQQPTASTGSRSLFTARDSPDQPEDRRSFGLSHQTGETPGPSDDLSGRCKGNKFSRDFFRSESCDLEINIPPQENELNQQFLLGSMNRWIAAMSSPNKRLKVRRIRVGQLLLHTLIRTLLPLISLTLSIVFPGLSTIFFFVGGVFGSAIAIIIPTICYLRIFRREISFYEKSAVALGTLIGVACTSLTVYVAITR